MRRILDKKAGSSAWDQKLISSNLACFFLSSIFLGVVSGGTPVFDVDAAAPSLR
jgi:hypothetical protein